jgi:hypothetical protein
MAKTPSANRGPIASPNTDAVIKSLKEPSAGQNSGGNAVGVNHNFHPFGDSLKGGGTIKTPATDSIVKK